MASDAERTKECLAELEAHFRENKTPSDVLIILGRTGSGKSSLLEDLSGLTGYSQQSVDSVTKTIQLCKAIVNDKPYFIMDTPGFDPNAEEKTYREIIRGVRSILPFALITGFLYLTCIPQERFDDFDRKLIQFIRALGGPQHIPRVTFITTFWTATPGQAASYCQRLVSLRRRWEDGVSMRGLKTYQHGWEYNGAGEDSGMIIDWFINREQIARHAKEMVARHYSSPSIVPSRIEEELDANVPIHETDAGRLLLPTPAPSQFTTSAHAAARPSQNASSHTDASNPKPPLVAHTSSNTTQEQTATPPLATSVTQVLLEGFSWFFRNINPGSAAGGAGPRPRRVSGDLLRGGDPLSHVDLMKSRGLDASREARVIYAQQHGIGGVPFSASWGNAMLRHLQRNG
ncbi:uncharacterized protein KD926_006443 [Aspergillus affinis]|uniref:uncharacterized protein n=1 Tax=Aspergillus affinis TaxID=1070780 RepID=UPI0022FF204F|nr:uncharacterized protein KD926_006443 [Aspergillus affinis]KAI9041897.1 hypothetical protein KD926_006443 [Aspergillus affinis]